MSLGHPGESAETAAETWRWLLEVRPADFDVTIITPYPGSPYYEDAVPAGEPGLRCFECPTGDTLYQREIDYTRVADYYKGNPDDGNVSHVFTEHLSPAQLVRCRDELERDVRRELGIPFNPSKASMLYEHSMGQSGLPRMLRKTAAQPQGRAAA